MRSAEALVMRPVPKLLWEILSNLLAKLDQKVYGEYISHFAV